jgi:mono/diheme cytochrome c family protein
MSQQNQNQDTHVANFTGVILILTFVVIFALVSTNLSDANSTPATPTPAEVQVIAQADPTDTPQPSATPLPPTFTPTTVPTNTPAPTATPQPSNTPVPTDTEVPPAAADADQSGSDAASYDPALVARGETLFAQCAACHAPDARGIPNLGKDLVDSEFVAGLSDDELVQFIITGRPIWDPLNTTGIDMPGKGGNPALTTEDIQAIVAYLRTLSDSHGAPAESASASSDTLAYDPVLIAEGETLFAQCAACHAPDGRGIPNLGKDLIDSEFVASLSDDELVQFIITGRPIWDPLNTTGIDMPGKGGNPALTSEQIHAIVAYIRSLSASSG